MRQLINFPVATFFFLSGYFEKGAANGESNILRIYKRAIKILIPFIFWSILYTVISLIYRRDSYDLASIFSNILLGKSAGHLYFIFVLLQFTLLSPILIKMTTSRMGSAIIFSITPLFLILTYTMARGGDSNFQPQLFFPAWVFFYYLGLWVKKNGKNQMKITPAIILCCTTVCLSIVESYVLMKLNYSDSFVTSQIRFSSFLYALSIINLFSAIKIEASTKANEALVYVGDCSYGIYYIPVVHNHYK